MHAWAPRNVVTNSRLEQLMDTTDEWITARTGIKERRWMEEEGMATSDLAVHAVEGLLKKTGTNPLEVELLICCTATPDMAFPATANVITDKLGMNQTAGFDLSAACSGFLFGLNTAARYIESGMYQKVIVVGADKMTSIIDLNDRSTAIIFGDGAGAVLLEPSTDDLGVRDGIMRSDGIGRTYLCQKAGGSLNPASLETVNRKEHYIHQEGKTVFKFAVTNMAGVAQEIMERNGLSADDVQWLVPHQANKRIIDATRERTALPEDKVMVNIQRYGNTTNASIPLCLHEWEPQLKRGDNLILAAFGGGFTWGSLYVRWAFDGAKALNLADVQPGQLNLIP
ncbi:MAG: ketoacyl-ACP synthase III [Bacteroidetes bacterium]|nr:ketoacyl-ACP synthase III [Bacteroidota bacterium]